ncbi:MAG: hypothetical protein JRH20_16220 [Deltaproteobacteria bacterium]|nr:hypothetical protein [Deltaproteobacteria bacterium]
MNRTARSTRSLVLCGLAGLAVANCSSSNDPATPDLSTADAPKTSDSRPQGDALSTETALSDSAGNDAAKEPEIVPLGLYVVKRDGTGLRLFANTGTKALTHVRAERGSDWLTATRYHLDADNNGFAMEGEGPNNKSYDGTEIVLFRSSDPSQLYHIAGNTPGKLCANSSFTGDGKVIHLQETGDGTVFKRVTFGTMPTIVSTETIPMPSQLITPVDPHQVGASDGTGKIVFSATFQHTAGWMRPVWRMPATGTSELSQVEVIGCPICPAQNGCCSWSDINQVLGTNDPRMDSTGTKIFWMHRHPDVSFDFGGTPVYVFRQALRVDGQEQRDFNGSNIDVHTTHSYGQWRPDDKELVYWSIDVDLQVGRVGQELYRMDSDGQNRVRLDLPPSLCVSQPSYLNQDEIIFTGWRCGGSNCSCAMDQIGQ